MRTTSLWALPPGCPPSFSGAESVDGAARYLHAQLATFHRVRLAVAASHFGLFVPGRAMANKHINGTLVYFPINVIGVGPYDYGIAANGHPGAELVSLRAVRSC